MLTFTLFTLKYGIFHDSEFLQGSRKKARKRDFIISLYMPVCSCSMHSIGQGLGVRLLYKGMESLSRHPWTSLLNSTFLQLRDIDEYMETFHEGGVHSNIVDFSVSYFLVAYKCKGYMMEKECIP